MSGQVEDNEIVVRAADWPAVREDPRFIELMRLARVTNSLALAYGPLLASLEDQSPRARRDRFAAFFFAAALLKEGLHTAQSLGKWFRDLPQYREGFAAIFSDQTVRTLQSDLLDRVRDELVFHIDRAPLAQGMAWFPDGDVLLATFPSSGPEIGETYFDAADDALLGYLFGDSLTVDEYLARLGGFMEQVALLFKRFMVASHRLLAVGLLELGATRRKGLRPTAPDEPAV